MLKHPQDFVFFLNETLCVSNYRKLAKGSKQQKKNEKMGAEAAESSQDEESCARRGRGTRAAVAGAQTALLQEQ